MKKLNTNSIFFRLAILFIVTVIVILTIIILSFDYFQESNIDGKLFKTPISHIHKIIEGIEEGKFPEKSSGDYEKKPEGHKEQHWKNFRRFTISVFDGDKQSCCEGMYNFTLKEFLKNSKPVKGFENFVTYKNNSYLVLRKGKKTVIFGNKSLKMHKRMQFRFVIVQLTALIVLILLIMYYFIHRLLIPVNSLLPALNEIRKGNFKYQIDLSTNDEFQSIIESFNEMASQIDIMFKNNLLLIGNISHDLKYYLTRMKMQVEIDIEDEESRISFHEDIDKMTEYIDRTVDVYQANANKTQFKIESIDISTLISEKYRDADIDIEAFDNGIVINTDENYFSLILDNLYDNAMKYGLENASASTVKLTLKKIDCSFELIIKNRTEFNYEPNEMNLLFQPFYRKDISRGQDIQGTGLGLFIVRQISDSLELNTELSIEDGDVFTVKISGLLRK